MKVVFAQGGAADLEAIADYIARDNPRRARTFVRELRTAATALAHAPEPPPRSTFDPRIRRAVYESYNIYYALLPGELRILAIVHGARADDALLFDLVRR